MPAEKWWDKNSGQFFPEYIAKPLSFYRDEEDSIPYFFGKPELPKKFRESDSEIRTFYQRKGKYTKKRIEELIAFQREIKVRAREWFEHNKSHLKLRWSNKCDLWDKTYPISKTTEFLKCESLFYQSDQFYQFEQQRIAQSKRETEAQELWFLLKEEAILTERLTEKQEQVLIRYYEGGKSDRQVGEELGIGQRATWDHRKAGLKNCREYLLDYPKVFERIFKFFLRQRNIKFNAQRRDKKWEEIAWLLEGEKAESPPQEEVKGDKSPDWGRSIFLADGIPQCVNCGEEMVFDRWTETTKNLLHTWFCPKCPLRWTKIEYKNRGVPIPVFRYFLLYEEIIYDKTDFFNRFKT